MIFTIFVTVLVVFWIILCFVVYGYHYIIEVVFDLPITGQSPCSAHTALKQLIQRIILEALELPKLKPASEEPVEGSDEVNEKTYEDLLATAILNKVIQKYQDDGPSSSGNSLCSRHSKSPKGKEYFFGKETLDTKYRNPKPEVESDSFSSLDDVARSDSSMGSLKSIDHLTLTIRQSIEENISNSDDSEEDPEPLYVRTTSSLFGGDDSLDFEDNWTLQKRKYASSSSPVPVPMLVPNPTTEAKVFIGEKEAENTSDLSDVASDYDEIEVNPTINSILVDSKTVIGGKNLLCFDDASFGKEEKAVVNGYEKGSFKTNGIDSQKETTDNGIVLSGEGVEDVSLLSVDSNVEKDTEYTEKYASLPRTILKSPQAKPRIPKSSMEHQDYVEELHINDDENRLESPVKGSYSEREKEKWKHPIPMKYNPYSKENIERRLSTRSSGSSISSHITMSTRLVALLDEDRKKVKNHRFGRDYYIREASKPKGARKAKSDIFDTSVENISPILISSPSVAETRNGDGLVKAVPIRIEEELSDRFTSLNLDNKNILEISSDSDLSIERTYNPLTGKITEKCSTDLNHNNVVAKSQFLKSQTDSEAVCSQKIESPMELTYKEFVELEKVEENFVPSKIKKYEQINSSTKQLSQSSPNLTSTPTPAPRSIRISQLHEQSKDMSFSEDLMDDYHEIGGNGAGDAKTPDFSEEELNFTCSTPDISLETQNFSRALSSLGADSEISDLQEKHLVKHILGKFSRSFPNLTKIPGWNAETPPPESKSADTSFQEINEVLSVLPSVQDLKKKFEATPADKQIKPDSKIVYSLTARSIPRQFRQELKNQEEVETSPHSSLDVHKDKSHHEIDVLSDSTEHLPKAKNTIEFFEKLGRQTIEEIEKST